MGMMVDVPWLAIHVSKHRPGRAHTRLPVSSPQPVPVRLGQLRRKRPEGLQPDAKQPLHGTVG